MTLDRFDLLMCEEWRARSGSRDQCPFHSSRTGQSILAPFKRALVAERSKTLVNEVWDFIGSLPEQLTEDIPHRSGVLKLRSPPDATTVGKEKVFIRRRRRDWSTGGARCLSGPNPDS